MKSLEHYWYQSDFPANFLAWLLLPLSALFCLVAAVRRKLYQLNIKKSYSASVPLIVVGNIVAGGSGKTPLLISLCEYIQQNGYKPGVVSRGYGGTVSGVKQVMKNDSAEEVGDEPLMIHQRTKAPVVVGADRVAAVNSLLLNNQCDIVLSDDGLQHYRMKRNFEIAVVDSIRGFGNGFCLPSGPLRETASRLNKVDMVVYNGDSELTGRQCFYRLEMMSIKSLNGVEQAEISAFVGKQIHAVAGIGNPSRFFKQLENSGLSIIEHAFSDHHHYVQEDFSGWETDCIIMTEKDAVKCSHLSLPDAWVFRVKADLSDELKSRLESQLLPLLKQ